MVEYPINSETGTTYQLSTEGEAVEGITEYTFKYLMLPAWNLEFDANIPDDSGGITPLDEESGIC